MCLQTSGAFHSVVAAEAWWTGPRCTLLMSVPRQKLDTGVFDVFLLPQVKRESHAAVQQQAKQNNKLIKLFLFRLSFNDATLFSPDLLKCSVGICWWKNWLFSNCVNFSIACVGVSVLVGRLAVLEVCRCEVNGDNLNSLVRKFKHKCGVITNCCIIKSYCGCHTIFLTFSAVLCAAWGWCCLLLTSCENREEKKLPDKGLKLWPNVSKV